MAHDKRDVEAIELVGLVGDGADLGGVSPSRLIPVSR
jgi:hypothetical protein